MQGLVSVRGGEMVEGRWPERAARKDEAVARQSRNLKDLII